MPVAILTLVGAGLVLIGIFSPWVTATGLFGISINRDALQLGADLRTTWVGPVLILLSAVMFVVGGLLVALSSPARSLWHLPLWSGIVSGFVVVLSIPVGLNQGNGVTQTLGFGPFICGFGSACAIVAAVIWRAQGTQHSKEFSPDVRA
jgi:hypothetical protein